jgi:hypothetical protein
VFVTPAIARQFWAGSATTVVDRSADGLDGYERRMLGMVWRSTHASRVREGPDKTSLGFVEWEGRMQFLPRRSIHRGQLWRDG